MRRSDCLLQRWLAASVLEQREGRFVGYRQRVLRNEERVIQRELATQLGVRVAVGE